MSERSTSSGLATEPRVRLVTPAWHRRQQREVSALQHARDNAPAADTELLMPGAQHPLEDGQRPGEELTERLLEVRSRYSDIVQNGGRAAILLAGNRHHDKRSGQTDHVALYDASGLFLLNHGVPAADLHGPDWTPDRLVYSGAMEIAAMADVYHGGDQFRTATYVCSPGQKSRARTYALAYRLPLEVVVPETLEASEEEQFHDSSLQRLVLQGLARTVDPYGDRILDRMTRDRIPADGITGTIPELLPEYAELPWYQNE